jgi:hypothetical protein
MSERRAGLTVNGIELPHPGSVFDNSIHDDFEDVSGMG